MKSLPVSRPAFLFGVLYAVLPAVIVFAPKGIAVVVALMVLALPGARMWRQVAGHRPVRVFAVYPLIGLMVWALISLQWSPQPAFAKWLSLSAFHGAGALAVLSALSVPVEWRQTVQSCIVFFIIAAVLLFILDALIPRGLVGFLAAETVSAVKHEQRAARGLSVLTVLVWPVIGVIVRRRVRTSWMPVLLIIGVLIGGVVLATYRLQAYACLLALMTGGAVLIAVYQWPRSAMIALALIILGYIIIAPTLHVNFINDLLLGAGWSWPPSWMHRLEIWSYAARATFDAPIAGIGFDGTRTIGQEFVPLPEGRALVQAMPLHAHNFVLQVWLELGLIGALFLAGVAAAALLALWFQVERRLCRASIAAMVASFLTIALISFGAWQTWWIGVAWLGIVTAVLCQPVRSSSDRFPAPAPDRSPPGAV